MPVTHTDFAFTEESFDPTEYPDEIRPTYRSDRFPFMVPKTKVDPATVSKTALQVRDRIAETAGVAPERDPQGAAPRRRSRRRLARRERAQRGQRPGAVDLDGGR